MSTEVIQQIRRSALRLRLTGQGVVVALSGGLDSVCLLRCLRELRDELGLTLAAAHVDHGLRDDSARDAGFCRQLSGQLGVPFHEHRLPPQLLRGRGGTQSLARHARRRFFNEVLGRTGATALALAHHADDQVETILFRLARGTGPTGLRGMRPWAPPLWRPLLDLGRRQLAELVESRSWEFREDPTNRSPRYARNRVRHRLLPVLSEAHPGAREAILRCAQLLAEDDAYLGDLARDFVAQTAVPDADGVRLPVTGLLGLAPPIRRRCHLAAWRAVGGEVGHLGREHVEQIEALLDPGRPQRRAALPGDVAVMRSYDDLCFLRAGWDRPPDPRALLYRDGQSLVMERAGVRLAWRAEPEDRGHGIGIPAGRGAGGLWVRPRLPGDRVPTLGGHRPKLKTLLIAARVPLWHRGRALVLGDDSGPLGAVCHGAFWGGVRGADSWVHVVPLPAGRGEGPE